MARARPAARNPGKERSASPKTLLQQALAREQAGDIRQAIAFYRRYLRHDPHDGEVLHTLGGLCYRQGDHESAERYLSKAHSAAPERLDFLSDLGALKLTLGDFPQAIQLLSRVLEQDPDFPNAHYNLGMALHGAGRPAEAVEAFKQAIELQPGYAPALFNLGITYQELGYTRFAEEQFRRAAEAEPYLAEAHFRLGEVLSKQNRHEAAIEALQRARELDIRHQETAGALAEALHEAGRTEEGIGVLQDSLTRFPDAIPLMTTLGGILHNAGRLEEAEKMFQKALSVKKDAALACLGYSRIRKFSADDDAVIGQMEEILKRPALTDRSRSLVCFALGKIYDDCEEYAKAFARYETANDLQAKKLSYDRAAHERLIDDIIATFTPGFFAERGHLGDKEPLPLFIVGMPRSGTTLTEQILASHSQVAGAGELAYFGSICAQLPSLLQSERTFPACCSDLNDALAAEIIQNYRTLLRRHSDTATLVTDKMPGNYLYLGLIRLLFPTAPIIHCQRHPLDVCLSIYFQNFNKSHTYAGRLLDIGHRYQQYARLMRHWHLTLGEPFTISRYDELIGNQPDSGRRLLASCGLEWEPACLEFYKHSRDVKTASNWQVRQPLYTTSSERWRRYEPQLEQLQSLLSKETAEYEKSVCAQPAA